MTRNLVILGSSGGNLYNAGGKNPKKLLEELKCQIDAAGMELAQAQFIAAACSMDQIKPTTKADLWVWDGEDFSIAFSGPLQEVNERAAQSDEEIATSILSGNIQGLILISADPEHTNKKALQAAAQTKIPAVGTGGTSMGKTQALGVKVIAASGTTGTTNRTRSIANIAALAKYWDIKYRPAIGKTSPTTSSGNMLSRINIRGIMTASLPGFIALAITLALGKIPQLSSFGQIFDTMLSALPVIVAAVAAKQVSDMDEVAIVAGVVSGTLSVSGGIIGGIIGGILAGILVQLLFIKCLEWHFPTTTANIVAGGIAGLAGGLFVYFLIGPLALAAGNGIRELINLALQYSPILCGALAGLLIWPAIICGVYHAAILPIVLLEMEKTGNSFLGAIDMCGLVMVSAGITLANIVSPRVKGEAALAAPGFFINVGFGTFVEAAYPFMFSNKIVFGGALISAALSGAFVGFFNVRGTAYVPSIAAPTLSNSPGGFVISMLIALSSAFIITLIANKMHKKTSSN